MVAMSGVIGVLLLLSIILAASTIKIAKEYERCVVFRLGRLIPLRGPGLFFIIPFGIDHVRKVDLRVITLEVPQQEVITSDNVTVKVNAVIFFQVVDPQAAIVRVYNFMEATSQIAQTTLRAVLGQSSLDELLGARDKINEKLQAIIDRQTEPWGIKVGTVELKDAQLAESMVRALARSGRGRTREASEDHRDRGGVPGCPGPRRRGSNHLHAARRSRVALHADAARYGVEPELHDRVSDSDRAHQAALGRARADADRRCS